MLHRSPRVISRISCLLMAFWISVALPSALLAQAGDGFTVQERPGLVLVKPQAWSTDAELSMVEFLAFTDRTVKSNPGAGYYEFQTKLGDKRQIPASKVVELVVYPDLSQTADLASDEDRYTLSESIKKLQSVENRFPPAAKSLNPMIKKLSDDLAQYDSGKVRIGGTWSSRSSYVATQAQTLVAQLKSDIARADPPSSFDLKNDPRFLTLQGFAETNPAIKAQVNDISSQYGQLARAEQRKKLLAKLANPKLDLEEAQGAVSQLRGLSPEEDPRSAAFLKTWDSAQKTVKATAVDASKLAYSLEAELSAFRSEDIAPQLSPGLDRQISNFNDSMRIFLATQPPPQLLKEAAQALAVCEERETIKKVKADFADKQFLDAKDTLDAFAPMAGTVGPETTRVVAGLQHYSATRIDEFTKLREEANLLAGSGKKADALKKYEAAYMIISDPDVAEKIAVLKGAPAK